MLNRYDHAVPQWQVRLLGRMRVERDGQSPVHFRTLATEAVFAYLALRLGEEVSREVLASEVWPAAEDLARGRNLRTALSSLRQSFTEALGANRQSAWLDPSRFDVDVLRFRRELDPALYRGRLLEGYDGRWHMPMLLELEELYFERVLACSFELSPQEAIALISRALTIDPTRLDLRARLRDLGPSFDTLQVPAVETSFVGRVRERAELEQLLTEHRLVTITGPGGCGKSRLAHQLVKDRYPNSWFVPLAHVSDPERILSTVASSLRISAPPGAAPLDALIHALTESTALLVLDNLEDLRDGAESVVELLDALPHLQVVVTSRVPLDVVGEVEYPLGPLEPGEAERLFGERCRLVSPDLDLARNQATLSELCRKLDGYPLALEICAAKARLLTLGEMLAELEDRFEFLTHRQALPRHRSLQHVLDVSCELLDPHAQDLLTDLAVFEGTFTRQSLADVVGPGRGEILAELVSSAWVLPQPGTDPRRFRLIESVRQFAADLAKPARHRELQERHARTFAAFAQTCKANAFTPRESALHDQAELELPNLEAAWQWLIRHDPAEALRLVSGINWFTILRGHWEWAETRLRQALDAASDAALSDLTFANHTLGNFLFFQGRRSEAEPWFERARSLARQTDDPLHEGLAILQLAQLRVEEGRYDVAQANVTEGVRVMERVGEANWMGAAHVIRVLVANRRGQIAEALAAGSTAVDYCREGGYGWGIASALNEWAMAHHLAGDHRRSLELQQESMEFKRQTSAPASLALSYADGASAHLALGDLAECRRWLREALQILHTHHATSRHPHVFVIASRVFSQLENEGDARLCRQVAERLVPVASRGHAHYFGFFEAGAAETPSDGLSSAIEAVLAL